MRPSLPGSSEEGEPMKWFKNHVCTPLAMFLLLGTTAHIVLGNALSAQAEKVKECVDQNGKGYGNPGKREWQSGFKKMNSREINSKLLSNWRIKIIFIAF